MEGTGVTPGLGRLRGKSAVVTGAAKGIGRATAELFAREGALLVLTDVDEAGLEELRERLVGEGVEVETVVGDVSVPEDAKRMIGAAVEHFGRIDVLVANAGLIPLNTIVDTTPEDWDHVMNVDGRGMFLTCKYAVEEMLKTGGGSIVCLSSISGGLRPGQVRRHRADQAPRGRVGGEGNPGKRGGAGHHFDRGGRGATGRVQGANAGSPPNRAARGALRGG
jgi:NAD(P)-dependent dehydrogenase (short-subunit alcohol dehydrogenase family)